MRYTPQQADEELSLYLSGIRDNDQYRFIEYKYELEDRFPICGVGMADDPGSCDDPIPNNPDSNEDNEAANASENNCGGCSGTGGLAIAAWFFGFIALLRRKA